MSYRSKRRITDIAVYAALTLVILTVITLTVATFVSARKSSGGIPDGGSPSDTPRSSEAVPDAALPSGNALPDDTPVSPTGGDETKTGLLLPVNGYILREFSAELPVFSETMQDYRTHCGVDVSAAIGEQVVAVGAGFVREITDDPMMGRTVRIEHEGDLVSVYGNLQAVDCDGITVGAAVTKGQIIGAVGDTALGESVESDHLHFELYEKGSPVNPATRLDFSAQSKEDRGGE